MSDLSAAAFHRSIFIARLLFSQELVVCKIISHMVALIKSLRESGEVTLVKVPVMFVLWPESLTVSGSGGKHFINVFTPLGAITM
jgi:hypothetical protein